MHSPYNNGMWTYDKYTCAQCNYEGDIPCPTHYKMTKKYTILLKSGDMIKYEYVEAEGLDDLLKSDPKYSSALIVFKDWCKVAR